MSRGEAAAAERDKSIKKNNNNNKKSAAGWENVPDGTVKCKMEKLEA